MERVNRRREQHRSRSFSYRALIVLVGFGAIAAGFAMLALPGPGLATIAVGLTMLALEFDWAARVLERTIKHAQRARASRPQAKLAIVAAGGAAALASILLFDIPFVPF